MQRIALFVQGENKKLIRYRHDLAAKVQQIDRRSAPLVPDLMTGS
ncbi:MAG: hypothetical protein WA373_18065 [Burkholderiales bacterium]